MIENRKGLGEGCWQGLEEKAAKNAREKTVRGLHKRIEEGEK